MKPVFVGNAVIVSENPIATLVGYDILKKGGNAIDAAASIAFTLSVTLPHLGGIGGDFFALITDGNSEPLFIDGSGPAPQTQTIELMKEKGFKEMPSRGVLTITVPGFVDAVYTMWKELGHFEWRELLKPAISLAEKGFPSSKILKESIESNKDILQKDSGSTSTYLRSVDGKIIKFPQLAKALKLIAEDPREFYEGDISEKIVNYVKSKGGVLDYEDLKRYKSSIGIPLKMSFRDYLIYEMPPPTQGITTLHSLKLLELTIESKPKLKSSARIKKYIQIFRCAYVLRDKFITDPKRMKVSINELLNEKKLQKLIFELCKDVKIVKKLESKEPKGDTTFFIVSDKNGITVAGIQSLYYPFGSGITEPTYGITLNNRGADFSLDITHVNKLEPGKRTLHTLSAMMVFKDKKVKYVIGCSGGHFRPQIHTEVFSNIVDYGMDIYEAMAFPRFLWDIKTNELLVEEGYKKVEIEGLKIVKKPYPSRFGVVALLEVIDDLRLGVADIRSEGISLGIIEALRY